MYAHKGVFLEVDTNKKYNIRINHLDNGQNLCSFATSSNETEYIIHIEETNGYLLVISKSTVKVYEIDDLVGSKCSKANAKTLVHAFEETDLNIFKG